MIQKEEAGLRREATWDFLSDLDQVVEDLQAAPPQEEPEALAMRRRRHGFPYRDDVRIMSISERDGVLFIDEGVQRARYGGVRRRGPRAVIMGGEPVKDIPLARLGRNEVGEYLERLDEKLTGNFGLHKIHGEQLEPLGEFPKGGRVLLFIHGTFSKVETLVTEFNATPEGNAFIDRLTKQYDHVLGFNHRTLSISPILNAENLARLVGESQAEIDVICHSRGGLVARWWLEAFDRADPRTRRAVFVASPLAGTGLAAPTNLRASLSLIANWSRALQTGGMLLAGTNPFLAFMTGVFQIVTSVTDFGAKTPVIDAAIMLIPGLASMSRVGTNRELHQLRAQSVDLRNRYFAVTSNFETEDVDWKFWRLFRKPEQRVMNIAADFVFDDHNDLVVDTSSMTSITEEIGFPKSQVMDFKKPDHVHHTNYFRNHRTLDFISEKLQIP